MTDTQQPQPLDPTTPTPATPATPVGPAATAVAPRGRRRSRAALLVAALAVGALGGGGVALAARSAAAPAASATKQAATAPVWWHGAGGYSGGSSNGYAGGYAGGSSGGSSSGSAGAGTYGDLPGAVGGGAASSGTSGATAGTSSETTTSPTAAQLTGLVRIDSTLTNGEAAGTGMVLTSDGRVVTNHHVVQGATSIQVTVMSTGRTYTATYVGGDATADVAVLQLQGASGLTPVTFAGADPTTGQAVTPVGDAEGQQTLTAAPGTVTALDQAIDVQGDDGTTHHLTGLVEMASDIVPGDSGGAVLDASGDVVAMNVAASSGTQDVTGYAIPASTVQQVVAEIVAGDASSTVALGYDGFLGVGLTTDGSTTVAGVEQGGPADAVGIAGGDTLTSVGGAAVGAADQLKAAVTAHHPGDRVAVTWTTPEGTTGSATVTLGTAPVA